MAVNSFRLVPKMRNNVCCIYMVNAARESFEVAHLLFPNDNQVNDNVETVNAITYREKRKKPV